MALVLPSDLFQRRTVATVSGMSGTAAGSLTIGSTFLIGWTSDRYSFAPLLIASSTVPFIGAILVCFSSETLRRAAKGSCVGSSPGPLFSEYDLCRNYRE